MALQTITVADNLGMQDPGPARQSAILRQLSDGFGLQEPSTSPPAWQTTQPPDRVIKARWGPGPGRRFRTAS